MVNSNSSANPNRSWLGLGNSLARTKFCSGPGCAAPEGNYSNFWLLLFFLNLLCWRKGSSRKRKIRKEKEVASGQIIQIEEDNLEGKTSASSLFPVCLIQSREVSSESESHSAMSYSLHSHGHTVLGILQARILEWIAFPFSKGSSQPRYQTQVSCIVGRFFTS